MFVIDAELKQEAGSPTRVFRATIQALCPLEGKVEPGSVGSDCAVLTVSAIVDGRTIAIFQDGNLTPGREQDFGVAMSAWDDGIEAEWDYRPGQAFAEFAKKGREAWTSVPSPSHDGTETEKE